MRKGKNARITVRIDENDETVFLFNDLAKRYDVITTKDAAGVQMLEVRIFPRGSRR